MSSIEKPKSNIHQVINTVLLTIIGIIAGFIYASNVSINNKLDSLGLDNQANKIEITNIKANYETKLDNQTQHKELENKIAEIKK